MLDYFGHLAMDPVSLSYGGQFGVSRRRRSALPVARGFKEELDQSQSEIHRVICACFAGFTLVLV